MTGIWFGVSRHDNFLPFRSGMLKPESNSQFDGHFHLAREVQPSNPVPNPLNPDQSFFSFWTQRHSKSSHLLPHHSYLEVSSKMSESLPSTTTFKTLQGFVPQQTNKYLSSNVSFPKIKSLSPLSFRAGSQLLTCIYSFKSNPSEDDHWFIEDFDLSQFKWAKNRISSDCSDFNSNFEINAIAASTLSENTFFLALQYISSGKHFLSVVEGRVLSPDSNGKDFSAPKKHFSIDFVNPVLDVQLDGSVFGIFSFQIGSSPLQLVIDSFISFPTVVISHSNGDLNIFSKIGSSWHSRTPWRFPCLASCIEQKSQDSIITCIKTLSSPHKYYVSCGTHSGQVFVSKINFTSLEDLTSNLKTLADANSETKSSNESSQPQNPLTEPNDEFSFAQVYTRFLGLEERDVTVGEESSDSKESSNGNLLTDINSLKSIRDTTESHHPLNKYQIYQLLSLHLERNIPIRPNFPISSPFFTNLSAKPLNLPSFQPFEAANSLSSLPTDFQTLLENAPDDDSQEGQKLLHSIPKYAGPYPVVYYPKFTHILKKPNPRRAQMILSALQSDSGNRPSLKPVPNQQSEPINEPTDGEDDDSDFDSVGSLFSLLQISPQSQKAQSNPSSNPIKSTIDIPKISSRTSEKQHLAAVFAHFKGVEKKSGSILKAQFEPSDVVVTNNGVIISDKPENPLLSSITEGSSSSSEEAKPSKSTPVANPSSTTTLSANPEIVNLKNVQKQEPKIQSQDVVQYITLGPRVKSPSSNQDISEKDMIPINSLDQLDFTPNALTPKILTPKGQTIQKFEPTKLQNFENLEKNYFQPSPPPESIPTPVQEANQEKSTEDESSTFDAGFGEAMALALEQDHDSLSTPKPSKSKTDPPSSSSSSSSNVPQTKRSSSPNDPFATPKSSTRYTRLAGIVAKPAKIPPPSSSSTPIQAKSPSSDSKLVFEVSKQKQLWYHQIKNSRDDANKSVVKLSSSRTKSNGIKPSESKPAAKTSSKTPATPVIHPEYESTHLPSASSILENISQLETENKADSKAIHDAIVDYDKLVQCVPKHAILGNMVETSQIPCFSPVSDISFAHDQSPESEGLNVHIIAGFAMGQVEVFSFIDKKGGCIERYAVCSKRPPNNYNQKNPYHLDFILPGSFRHDSITCVKCIPDPSIQNHFLIFIASVDNSVQVYSLILGGISDQNQSPLFSGGRIVHAVAGGGQTNEDSESHSSPLSSPRKLSSPSPEATYSSDSKVIESQKQKKISFSRPSSPLSEFDSNESTVQNNLAKYHLTEDEFISGYFNKRFNRDTISPMTKIPDFPYVFQKISNPFMTDSHSAPPTKRQFPHKVDESDIPPSKPLAIQQKMEALHPHWPIFYSFASRSKLLSLSHNRRPKFINILPVPSKSNQTLVTFLSRFSVGEPVFDLDVSWNFPYSDQRWIQVRTMYGSYFISFPLI